tara:strand:- start:635 stop:1585 length:951 start_codon:yes stop_codon:yes gene_type:complete
MIAKRRAFIIGLKSTKISKKEKFFLKKYKPWGVILFSRNLKKFKQIKKLTKDIRYIFKDKKYPILIDQEGGRINRLSGLIDTSIFTAEYFGNLFKKNKKKFNIFYKVYINQISYLLNELGININTVPVLDIRYSKTSNIIGDRSYSRIAKNVSNIGDFCIKEFSKMNIGTVIKHIPGHGLAKVDSHKKTPLIKNNLNFLKKNDFFVFKNKKTYFAMTAHVIYYNLDPNNVVTHSSKIINFIRNEIGYKNLIISDDVSMKSLKHSIKKNTQRALLSGCNLILHCNAKYSEMRIVANNSPFVDKFIVKKTSQFYNFLS